MLAAGCLFLAQSSICACPQASLEPQVALDSREALASLAPPASPAQQVQCDLSAQTCSPLVTVNHIYSGGNNTYPLECCADILPSQGSLGQREALDLLEPLATLAALALLEPQVRANLQAALKNSVTYL